MKYLALLFLFVATLVSAVIAIHLIINKPAPETGKIPNDWFFLQRSFPYPEINYDARAMAWKQSQTLREESAARGEGWLLKGPLNIGGRIAAMAMITYGTQSVFAGAASGGIFKSSDLGQSWRPIFDEAMSLSIGDIAIAPSDTSVIWVGTGEANAGGGSMSYDGNGIYLSEDAGLSWNPVGLYNSGSIGRLVVHPDDPQTCYVAAMGRLFSDNPERGIFKTSDGGGTWDQVLYINDSVGAIDIVMHPAKPDTLYATTWERVRRPHRRDYGGPGSGIYRSYDGGDTWTLLTNGLPAASAQVGRIGIDISASDPDILYAIYADNIGYFDGLYKTVNGGNSWFRTSDEELADCYASYGWWFGRIAVDPQDPDVAYVIGFDLYKTIDGGNNWSYISSDVHVDQHDIVIHPDNTDLLVLGNDGGVYFSYNGGYNWDFCDNLPITQFYTCEVDEQYPFRLYGGTQDNGTNRTYTGALDNWMMIYGGDGFHVLVDPVNNSYVYAEYQYGNLARSTNGGISFTSAMSGISGSDRKNWNTPVVFDPSDPQILYYGANRLYRSTNRAVSWQAVSPDLTGGSGSGSVVYGTITTISVSPLNSQVIYAGTDDGFVWRTADGGQAWTDISFGLPLRWITRVAADPYDEDVVYVTLSGYRYDSSLPHVFRSADNGGTWDDISGNLPEAPVNDIIIDPALDSTIYLATDFGVFVSRNLGQGWQMLGDNLPNVPIVDLDFHQPTRTLIAATYGRSMYTFDLDQTVSVSNLNDLPEQILLYPNPAKDYINLNHRFNENIHYSILDLSGKEVKKGRLAAKCERHSLIINDLKPGSYIFKLAGHNRIITGKFEKL
ncbi:MAG: T9SS type A sorting domain-containing protein [Bacteroidales bacterium]|nr:T9SS type A sorting domain-containing protein [Bacteroidales bacterium]